MTDATTEKIMIIVTLSACCNVLFLLYICATISVLKYLLTRETLSNGVNVGNGNARHQQQQGIIERTMLIITMFKIIAMTVLIQTLANFVVFMFAQVDRIYHNLSIVHVNDLIKSEII